VDPNGFQRTYDDLRLSEERFRLLVDGVKEYAILMLDPEGNVLSWNAGAQRLIGYRAEEILGLHISRFYPDEGVHPSAEEALAIAAREGHFREEGWRVRMDGSRFWADVTLTALRDRGGALRGFAKITHDMTERRAADEEIRTLNAELEQRVRRRTGELAQALTELEAFSYSVSHDLRAPLRAIDGFSQALLGHGADGLDEQGRHYLDRIRAGARRMSELIDDLLLLSRVNRSKLRRGPVDIGEIATAIVAEHRRRHPDRQVDVRIAEGMSADGDLRLLAIALENMLDNAWKFTSQKPRARIEVGAETRESEAVYFVRDDGAGFDMAHADKLFGAFQRLHDAADFEGTGIGLATAQRVIARHGGRIWAEGRPGEGATFFFTLGAP
jgi:PAS domain S-box-containing protein